MDEAERRSKMSPAARAMFDELEEWAAGRQKADSEPRPRERKLDTAPVDWSAVIDQRIAAMQAFLLDVVGAALGEALDRERREAQSALADQVRELKLELARSATAIAEMRAYVAALKSGVVVSELPPLPARELN